MKGRLCFIVILGVCNAAQLNTNEEEARKFAQNASEILFGFHDQLVNDSMEVNSNYITNLYNLLETNLIRANVVADIVRDAKQFDHTIFKDDELRHIFNQLRKSLRESVLGRDRFLSILSSMGALEDLAADEDIEGYTNKNVNLAYFPDIQNIFAISRDPKELLYYWTAWRANNDKWVMRHLLNIVDGIKDAANILEISAYEYWMKNYNMTVMDGVMRQIEPFYRQLHAFIRNQLLIRYGNSVIKSNGLIPDHLFQQVLAQAWTNGSVLDANFPHSDLPSYKVIFKLKNFDSMKLFKKAENFYESLGFDAIPESYWGTKLTMNTYEDQGDCKATILSRSSNVYMHFCQKMDFRTFLQAHGYMAEIHYSLEKNQLPAYYFDSYDLEYAVGEAVILSASSQKHLSTVGIVTDFEVTEEVFMNQLMRLNVDTMLNIPIYFVHTKVMADLFANKVEINELNKHYWKLMEKYVGVGPPSDCVSNTLDFSYNFYLGINSNRPARKFNSKVLSYQLYMKLCSITGKYPKGNLQNCDFYGSKIAGDALRKMMKLGSSRPSHEVLATILPENPEVSAESLIEYFLPAFSKLKVSNEQNNVQIGWTHSN